MVADGADALDPGLEHGAGPEEAGIFDQVDSLLGTLAGSEGGGFELKKVASLGQVASFAVIIAVINVVLLTALSMLSAVLYNISATLVGGIGVTLTDD